MNLVTEYLIIVDKEASEAFYHLCDNVDGFNKLLASDPDISISGNVIVYKENLKAGYRVKTSKVGGKQQRFFLVLTDSGVTGDSLPSKQRLRDYAASCRDRRTH